MSSEKPITRENLNEYLKELAKEFRKLSGSKMSAEVILVGGAAVLINYDFREQTYDIDAIIGYIKRVLKAKSSPKRYC